MSYKVHYRGVELICDTLDDVDAVLERQGKAASKPIDLPFQRQPVQTNGQIHTIKELVARQKQRPRKALKALVNNGGQMQDTELFKVVRAKNAMALAGILNPIYRLAKENGIEPATVLRKEDHINDQNEKIKKYVIPAEALDEVREALKV